MLVDAAQVVPYLLRRDLISQQEIISGNLEIIDQSRRNRVFFIHRREAPSYVLKQGAAVESVETVRYEARVLALLHSSTHFSAVNNAIPAFYGYDAHDGILTTGFVEGGRDFRVEFHERRRLSLVLSRALGQFLGRLHSIPVWAMETTGIPSEPPWIYAISSPTLTEYVAWSSGSRQVVEMIQSSDETCERLQRLRDETIASHLIHQDLRWDNCLAHPPPGSLRRTRIAIVDWESTSLGDPAWDIGCVLGDFLGLWISSMPIVGDAVIDDLPMSAAFPLSRMWPSLRAFWAAYVASAALSSSEAASILSRASLNAGVRLLQMGFEQMQMRSDLTGNVVAMVQVGHNVIQRPRTAACDLLGLLPASAI